MKLINEVCRESGKDPIASINDGDLWISIPAIENRIGDLRISSI